MKNRKHRKTIGTLNSRDCNFGIRYPFGTHDSPLERPIQGVQFSIFDGGIELTSTCFPKRF